MTLPLKTTILHYRSRNSDYRVVTERLYLHDRAFATSVNDDIFFAARKLLSDQLNVPITSVVLAGSGQTGWSVARNAAYSVTDSDLDFAIIDSSLYHYALEEVVKITRGYCDLTQFNSPTASDEFRRYSSKGIIRPDLLPVSKIRSDWMNLRFELQRLTSAMAKDATFVIYLTDRLFTGKQVSAVNELLRILP